jgi:hypothetical protein
MDALVHISGCRESGRALTSEESFNSLVSLEARDCGKQTISDLGKKRLEGTASEKCSVASLMKGRKKAPKQPASSRVARRSFGVELPKK